MDGAEDEMRIVSLNIGRPVIVVHGERRYSTSINRIPVEHPVRLTTDGFEGDRVGDPKVHGGPDKVACCYPIEHYDFWRHRLNGDLGIPSFGENLTTQGLLETEACIGDVLRIGGAVVQVSQPRQPCRKMADKHGESHVPLWMLEQVCTGFYVRVIEVGTIKRHDEIRIVERTNAKATIDLAVRTINDSEADSEQCAQFAALPELSASWRERMAEKVKRARGGESTDAGRRAS